MKRQIKPKRRKRPIKPGSVREVAKATGLPESAVYRASKRLGVPLAQAAAVVASDREAVKSYRERQMKARAEILEAESATVRGELVKLADMEAANEAAVAIIQTDIMAMGELLAPVLYGKDMVGIKEEIDKHARRLIGSWQAIPGLVEHDAGSVAAPEGPRPQG